MKPSFAVAVLLGLATLTPGSQAASSSALRRHHHYHGRVAVPMSREYVQARDIDEMDIGNEEEESSRAQMSREDAAEAETERMERLAQRSRRDYGRDG